MAVERMTPIEWLHKRLVEADEDVVREMLATVAQTLMSAEADSKCGAEFGSRSADRVNRRNGYRERQWDTRAGTIPLSIPKLREGTYFPEWLLDRRRRAEQAITAVIAESYLLGVSTRKVEHLVQAMGLTGISKSQVSEMAKSLDATVEDFRTRPLDAGPYRYVWLDAMVVKCREGGRVVNVAVVVATGVNAEGRREILGTDVITREDGPGWLAFLRSLVARGLSGVELVVSDAHEGLKDAIAATFPGASWQRCRTHFMTNLLTRVPKAAAGFVATLVRSVFAQPDADSTWTQIRQVVDQLLPRFPKAATMLDEAATDILAFTAFPKLHWTQIRSNNPQERLNKEIRRRTDVVGIFPNREAVIRLVGAVLAEQHDEWAIARRYMTLDSLAPASQPQFPNCLPATKEVSLPATAA
ncbi:MAG: IS256 family transposase [Thermoanaerobaculaceae bacterium]